MGAKEGLEALSVCNKEMINTMIEVIGIISSFLCVYYGRKAYTVAKEIFEKGIQIDKQKVLQQISLEFVTGFFIPLSKLKAATKPIKSKPYDAIKVMYMRELIKDYRFSIQFPYFDANKADVWNSLTICKEMEQAEAFNVILGFIEKARDFDRILTDLSNRLDDYLNPEDELERQKRASSTLNDFFEKCPSINKDMFDKGLKMIEDLTQYESKLPKELKITEMKRNLLR